jgi:hypothetical protein
VVSSCTTCLHELNESKRGDARAGPPRGVNWHNHAEATSIVGRLAAHNLRCIAVTISQAHVRALLH